MAHTIWVFQRKIKRNYSANKVCIASLNSMPLSMASHKTVEKFKAPPESGRYGEEQEDSPAWVRRSWGRTKIKEVPKN